MKNLFASTTAILVAVALSLVAAAPAQAAADETYGYLSCGSQWAGTQLMGIGSHNHTATQSGIFRQYTYPSQGAQAEWISNWGGAFHWVDQQTVFSGGSFRAAMSGPYCAA
ncbi:hypothetical protein [Agromyces larvae]|uniref:Lactococcin 972 family bacteriocin n=1 Tax=Agromyces larvae TaxID=2929802 RepID=A0ABY4BYM3_9MICO|nr:hypothetical protein [Agromyces larvae]UOE42823.1 hypothetical protein MTO99_11540 [Agromyces larvae]